MSGAQPARGPAGGYRDPERGAVTAQDVGSSASWRITADDAFSRIAAAPLVPGNSLRLLKDAGENYPA